MVRKRRQGPANDPTREARAAFPRVQPKGALAYFRSKGFREGFHWQDVWQEEHARAFTVAKAMSRDVLETIRAAVDKAIDQGETLAMFQKELTPLLQAQGWWGKKEMTDPLTGERKEVQLGSPRRLKIIYETNIRMAMMAGEWQQIERHKDTHPYLKYTAVMDERTRPEHAEWSGTILPVDDPWWDSHYPPCGWNCRCTVISYSDFGLAQSGLHVSTSPPKSGPPREFINSRTGEVTEVPAGIDPGFAYNVGKAWLGGMAPPPLLPPDLPGVTIGKVPAHAPEPASLLPADVSAEAAVAAFMDGARVPRTAGAAGAVVLDPEGWPLAISEGWFRDEGGSQAVPTGDRRRVLGLVGRALREPANIVWRWVKGLDGKPMLFRRYLARVDGLAIAVDVGKAGWRYASERDAGFDLTRLLKGGKSAALEEGATFQGVAGEIKAEAYASAAMAGALDVPALAIGTYPARLAARLEAFGVKRPARIVTLEAARARHILQGHGIERYEEARGQIAVTIYDLGKLAGIINAIDSVERTADRSGNGQLRLLARSTYEDVAYTLIIEPRKHGLTVITMWRKRPPA